MFTYVLTIPYHWFTTLIESSQRMEDSTFVKMKKSDPALLGNPQIIICGFKPKDQDLFEDH